LPLLGGALARVSCLCRTSRWNTRCTGWQLLQGVFKVGHGCQGRPQAAIVVQIPAGVQGARPMPKAGWTLASQAVKSWPADDSHGKTGHRRRVRISWTAQQGGRLLQNAWFDEFVLQAANCPKRPACVLAKVMQVCEEGSADWAEVPKPPEILT
jgi:uncharacterized protein YcnI